MNTDPDPSELKNFLRSEAPPGSVQFEAPPEVAAELEELATSADTPEPEAARTEIPLDARFEPNQPTESNILHWTLKQPDLGVIKVEEFEKILYLKSVDSDTPLTLDISLPMGADKLKVEVCSRSVFEERAIFTALDIAAYERKEFHDPATFATRAQQLSAAVQVKAINSRAQPALDLSAAGADVRMAGDLIEQHATKVIGAMSGPRWGAILSALRIFEIKLKICNDNVNNETFWTPAS